MYFILGLPGTSHGHNVVWVIIDKLTKLAHFLAMKTTNDVTIDTLIEEELSHGDHDELGPIGSKIQILLRPITWS